MHLVGTCQVRRALADHGLAADQGRFVGQFGLMDRSIDGLDIMTIDSRDHIPAIGFETLRGVVLEPAFDVTVDRDAIVVIQHDQLGQTQGTRQ